MRILYSHRTQSADGQYVHIEALTRALVAQGHEVLMCGPEGVGHPDDIRKTLDVGETRAHPLKQLPFGLYEVAEYGYAALAYRQLAKAAAQFAPDIIYERYNLFYPAGKWVAARQRLPFLLEVNAPIAWERQRHGDLKNVGLANGSERKIWQAADALLPVTEVLGGMIAEKGVDREKIHVIPNGVDARTFDLADPAPVRRDYPLGAGTVLGFVGFVRDWHGVDRVLDWMATPGGAACTLFVVGDGPAVPALRAQAARLKLEDRFIVTGVVQREAVAAHIAAFDIALQPAVTAYASPLKLQEYMAQARAIIAPDQPNIRETVTQGQSALLIDPESKPELFAALDQLVREPDTRTRLGQAARQTLLDRDMTWDANARRVVDIAKTVMASKVAQETVTNSA